jgi:hypothetical protein
VPQHINWQGQLVIEETGGSPICPICGSHETCPHLVAVLDLTFLECTNGALFDEVYEFSDLIKGHFVEFLESGTSPKDISSEIEAMWKHARECFDPISKDVEIDGDAFYRFLNTLLEEAGAISIQAVSEGGPGMSSSLRVLYAEFPDKVVQNATAILSRMLVA